jgi:hypothetical protein
MGNPETLATIRTQSLFHKQFPWPNFEDKIWHLKDGIIIKICRFSIISIGV